MILPPSLQKGDKIAIVSPASPINHDYVDGACKMFRQWGFVPVVSEHCKGEKGTYSGSVEERVADLKQAFADKDVKAILCSRGGYGTTHLLEYLPSELIQANPKWVIGFSDISALHAMMSANGICSIHASMAKQLTLFAADNPQNEVLLRVLTGSMPEYEIAPHPFNRIGSARAKINGGNMAVSCGLLGTPFDMMTAAKVLFIEDVGEPIYKIERMLYNLRLEGMLPKLYGLIVGQFTELKEPDGNGDTMYDMIHRMVQPYQFPVAFGFPIGHVDENIPIIEGALVDFKVTEKGASLKFLK
jgi:muramoyltetrapeptide carboxypeptidase